MKHFVRLDIAACQVCIALFLQSSPSLVGQDQQQSTSVNVLELGKVCGVKNPPPCATPPRATFSPSPEYSSEARSAHYQGVCVLSLIVETNGHASHIRVASSLGMGLDEKAIEAVKRWKFKPAMQNGKPIPVQVAVEVAFHL